MKNRHASIMILVTCIFAAFTLGFLIGRTTAPGDTIVSQLSQEDRTVLLPPAETHTVPSEPSAPSTAAPIPAETDVPSSAAAGPAETSASPAMTPTEAPVPGLININTATVEQLDTLPGIGPVIGQRIIDYRNAHGPFTAVSQLVLVDGIGEKRLAAILDLITVE